MGSVWVRRFRRPPISSARRSGGRYGQKIAGLVTGEYTSLSTQRDGSAFRTRAKLHWKIRQAAWRKALRWRRHRLMKLFLGRSGPENAQKARKRFGPFCDLKSPATLACMDDAASQTQADERQVGPDERLITLTEATNLLLRIDGRCTAR